MHTLEIIQNRIDTLKTQRDNDTMPQNVQLYEFAIRQLELVKKAVEVKSKGKR